jgi:hypothetical protein
MPNVNLSRMPVEALMDLRKRLKKCFLSIGLSFKSSWTGWMLWSVAEGLSSEAVQAF